MGGRIHRERLRANARAMKVRFSLTKKRLCSNCKEELGVSSGHFVPPGMGDPGFFSCTKKP